MQEREPGSRQALFDFNKLVIGAGENKLFVAPLCLGKMNT